MAGSSEREYRDDYPLSDAIRDARREGEDNVQSWSSAGRNVRDELDYAVARADALEARIESLTAACEGFLELYEGVPIHPGATPADDAVLVARAALKGEGNE